jgi:hypothetical protein
MLILYTWSCRPQSYTLQGFLFIHQVESPPLTRRPPCLVRHEQYEIALFMSHNLGLYLPPLGDECRKTR